MKSIIIIPARMASERLPGKPLIEVGGRTLIEYTYDAAKQTKADYVLVTSPDREITKYCARHDMPSFPSSREGCPTGTHRVAEVFNRMKEVNKCDVIINWQCDEVLANPEDVNSLIDAVSEHEEIATIAAPTPMEEFGRDTNRVKVRVSDVTKRCLDFSRWWTPSAMEHVGIYAYTRQALETIYEWAPTHLATLESLEQLAWLEGGISITAVVIDKAPLAINTHRDLAEFKRIVESAEVNTDSDSLLG